jgi:DNA mismatch repair protein MutS
LAGLPMEVISRAQAVLSQLEQPESVSSGINQDEHPTTSELLPHPHPMIEEVKQIDLFSMTPLDALNRLAELQRMVRSERSDPSDR